MTLSTSYIDPRYERASSLSDAPPLDCEGEQQIGNGSAQYLTKGRPRVSTTAKSWEVLPGHCKIIQGSGSCRGAWTMLRVPRL